MNITNLKNIFSAVTTFTSSTINHFQSGKVFEFPNEGAVETYPLLYLEEDYIIDTENVGNTKMDVWSFSFLVVNTINEESTKEEKDLMRDAMLEEAEKIVSYLTFIIKSTYKGEVRSKNYLSLLDYEQDNSQGWRVDVQLAVKTMEVRCNPYQEEV